MLASRNMEKILSSIFALALQVTAGYGVSKSVNGNADLNDLALSNVEALAMTEEEFYNLTGCCPCWEYLLCLGKDGNTYSYAYKC